MLLRHSPRLVLVATLAFVAAAAGASTPPVVFHSPNDDGTPHPVTFQLGDLGLHTLRLYIETGPDPSPTSGGEVVCLDALGDEICAWHLDIETTGEITIDSFTPDPALAASLRWGLDSTTLLRMNRVHAAGGGDFGALRIGELVVDHLGPGEVRMQSGSHAASASLGRLPVEGNPIAVPEPSEYLLLGAGAAVLALLGRLRPS